VAAVVDDTVYAGSLDGHGTRLDAEGESVGSTGVFLPGTPYRL
jgi:hypothetical protein